MQLENTLIFVLILILILWEIKADFTLILFSVTAYIYLVFYISFSDPLETLQSILDTIIFNPFGLLFLFIILGIVSFFKLLKVGNRDE